MEVDIKNVEEKFEFTASIKKQIFIIGGLGLVFFVLGLFMAMNAGHGHDAHGGDHGAVIQATDMAAVNGVAAVEAEGGHHGSAPWLKRVFANLWINNIYFTGLALIGVFFFAIQYIANAGWSVGVVRVMSAQGAFLPVGAVLIIAVFFVAKEDLFHWTHHGIMEEGSPNYDPIIAGKEAFLNMPFYLGRMFVFLGVWSMFAWILRRVSTREDIHGGTKYFRKMVRLSAAFIIFFGVSTSISAWDWVMSIDTHWFSTMFGWYVFASWFAGGLAGITLIVVILKELGYLKIVNENHLHDLGKFVFGFSIFWTYIWFSQFLLIYYANLPEEGVYFLERLQSDYYSKFIFINLILNFFFPFLALMTRHAKRKTAILKIVCVTVLIGHWLDFYLMVTPGTLKEAGGFSFLEIGGAMIYLSVFAFMAFSALTKYSLIPKNHPMLEESIHHHI